MRINFILPGNSNLPIGGNKIVYQYANELCSRGHQVSLTFLFDLRTNKFRFLLKYILRNQIIKRSNSHKHEITWFSLNKKIKINFDVIFLSEVTDADVVIATEARTTEVVSKLNSEKGKKYYFIQQAGERATYIPNFYNPSEFYINHSIKSRKNIVSLLSHSQKTKRTELGLEILSEVKKQIPDLQVELFGTTPPENGYADYVNFTNNASIRELREDIYGVSKIYLLASELEGWGLTGMEAQACGTALVSGRIGGVTEYATDDNSTLVDPNKKEEYVTAIVSLLKDEDRRISLVKKSQKMLSQFTLKNSVDKLEKILEA